MLLSKDSTVITYFFQTIIVLLHRKVRANFLEYVQKIKNELFSMENVN